MFTLRAKDYSRSLGATLHGGPEVTSTNKKKKEKRERQFREGKWAPIAKQLQNVAQWRMGTSEKDQKERLKITKKKERTKPSRVPARQDSDSEGAVGAANNVKRTANKRDSSDQKRQFRRE